MLSIIIPTFNEEKYLPHLLSSIRQQKTECEIIVSDNDSKDKTKEIAKNAGCILVEGGCPAKGRNMGAKVAKHDLLFIDSDTVLPPGFLEDFHSRIRKENLIYASCRVKPITEDSNHLFCYMLKNYGNKIACAFSEHVSGQCLFVKKDSFQASGGYDESLYLGEEHDLGQRLKKIGRGKLYMDIHVYNFPRRLERDGTYRSLAKDMASEAYRLAFGKMKKKIYEREYGHY